MISLALPASLQQVWLSIFILLARCPCFTHLIARRFPALSVANRRDFIGHLHVTRLMIDLLGGQRSSVEFKVEDRALRTTLLIAGYLKILMQKVHLLVASGLQLIIGKLLLLLWCSSKDVRITH